MADINDLNLLNEVVEVDGAASSEEFFNPPLPDDGEHEVIIRLGNRGVTADRQWDGKGSGRKRTGSAFLNVHVQLKGTGATGVRISPWTVRIRPRRARLAPSVCSREKENIYTINMASP